MKKMIIMVLLLIPIITFSQKIKVKKDVVYFDGKEVLKVNTKLRNNYKFTTPAGEKVFDIVFKGLGADNLEGFQWLEMTSAEGEKTEIPYEVLTTSFNTTKLIVVLLKEKYELFNSSGLVKDKITAFFNKEREVLSDKYLKAVTSANAEAEERKSTVGRYKPFVKDDGIIVFGGSQGSKIVGRVSYGNNTYYANDLDGITIGTAKGCSTCTTVKATTYTDETFEYDYGSKTMMSGRFSRSEAQVLVEELVGRNYLFGREAKQHKKRLHNEKVKIAKENSINLYGVPGSVTDKDGKTYTGTVYAIFEKLQLDPSKQVSDLYDMNSIDKYGKFVSIKYLNEKGRERIKKFSAKNNIHFCAVDEGEELCFYGTKTKGNALKKLSNASNFGFDNSYFYRIIYNLDDNMILSKPGQDNLYVLKLKDKEVGFMIDERNNEKLSDALAKFIDNCKNLAADIKQQDFDLKNLENLRQIINEYNSCK
ncbi:hypothetical protein [Pseudofulvibacter geojedonensis]|uniref:Uncharacterized protein n=1 Tax=Pseudofulvibacter geojedonensis TaxID=1123758 RepID=A0ABW3I1C9_9FLAO